MLFILLLLITTVAARPQTTFPSSTTPFMTYDSVLGYSCHSDTNCGGLVGNSRCLNGICACQPGYVPQGIMNCVYAGNDKTTMN
ncbi:unnamed protein product [Adineta steineri]|uniref:EB domain-containing protein n=1 Tax=Adineta steineri TaxID=433720 RepID=A0A814QY98_9BILA|nr:unnamed protein product [Adineta steineri]CAF1124357.1 unnamed protein product [Adineta steineri]